MTACEKIDQILDAYAAGELSDEQAFEVEKHLQACSRCAVQLAALPAGLHALAQPQAREQVISRGLRELSGQ